MQKFCRNGVFDKETFSELYSVSTNDLGRIVAIWDKGNYFLHLHLKPKIFCL